MIVRWVARSIGLLAGTLCMCVSIALAAVPDTPTNTSPIDEAASQSRTPLLTASTYADPDTDPHAASQWQISISETDFSSPIWDSGVDALNLESIDVPFALTNNTTYYWRVRYQDSNTDWSSYSDPTSFTPAKTQVTSSGGLDFASGEVAIIAVSVQNSHDDPVSDTDGATATIDIYDPTQTALITDDPLTYLSGSDGVFYYGYTVPATEGVYTFTVAVTYNDQISYGSGTFHASLADNTVVTNLDTTLSSVESTITTAIDDAETALTAEIDANEAKLDIIDQNVDDIETLVNIIDGKIDTISTNVDDIETIVTTIDTNVDDIQSTVGDIEIIVDDTNDRVRDIQNMVEDIAHDVDEINTELSDIDDLIETVNLTIQDQQDNLIRSNNVLAELEVQLGFSGKSESVWERIDALSGKVTSTYDTLGIQTTSIDRLLALDTAGDQNLTSVLNLLSDLRGASAAADQVVAGAENPTHVVSTWFTYGSVIQNFMVVNPTNETLTVPVEGTLPMAVTEADIIDLGGMTLTHNNETNTYTVTASIELAPGASHVFRVEMKDVFVIPETDLATLAAEATRIATEKGTREAHDLEAQIHTRVNSIRSSQGDVTMSADTKVTTFNDNRAALALAQEELTQMTTLGTEEASGDGLPLVWWVLGWVSLIIIASLVALSIRRRRTSRKLPPAPRGPAGSTGDQVGWNEFLNQFGKQ